MVGKAAACRSVARKVGRFVIWEEPIEPQAAANETERIYTSAPCAAAVSASAFVVDACPAPAGVAPAAEAGSKRSPRRAGQRYVPEVFDRLPVESVCGAGEECAGEECADDSGACPAAPSAAVDDWFCGHSYKPQCSDADRDIEIHWNVPSASAEWCRAGESCSAAAAPAPAPTAAPLATAHSSDSYWSWNWEVSGGQIAPRPATGAAPAGNQPAAAHSAGADYDYGPEGWVCIPEDEEAAALYAEESAQEEALRAAAYQHARTCKHPMAGQPMVVDEALEFDFILLQGVAGGCADSYYSDYYIRSKQEDFAANRSWMAAALSSMKASQRSKFSVKRPATPPVWPS